MVTVNAAELVWYVAYGSNLNRDRFLAYLRGGRVAGNEVLYEGCADTSPPVDDVPMTLANSLYFAGWSDRVWGGTSAGFITLGAHVPPALARAYLITRGQFLDVVRQENAGRSSAGPGDLDRAVAQARERGHARLQPTGPYRELVYCGERDGRPLLSFTTSVDRTDVGPPSEAYLRVIGRGLQECHGLDRAQVAAYLGEVPGVRGHWSPPALREALRAGGLPGAGT